MVVRSFAQPLAFGTPQYAENSPDTPRLVVCRQLHQTYIPHAPVTGWINNWDSTRQHGCIRNTI
jgi:hypothetical protein